MEFFTASCLCKGRVSVDGVFRGGEQGGESTAHFPMQRGPAWRHHGVPKRGTRPETDQTGHDHRHLTHPSHGNTIYLRIIACLPLLGARSA